MTSIHAATSLSRVTTPRILPATDTGAPRVRASGKLEGNGNSALTRRPNGTVPAPISGRSTGESEKLPGGKGKNSNAGKMELLSFPTTSTWSMNLNRSRGLSRIARNRSQIPSQNLNRASLSQRTQRRMGGPYPASREWSTVPTLRMLDTWTFGGSNQALWCGVPTRRNSSAFRKPAQLLPHCRIPRNAVLPCSVLAFWVDPSPLRQDNSTPPSGFTSGLVEPRRSTHALKGKSPTSRAATSTRYWMAPALSCSLLRLARWPVWPSLSSRGVQGSIPRRL